MPGGKLIACFSVEIALNPHMPTYSRGLGMLAGDAISRGKSYLAGLTDGQARQTLESDDANLLFTFNHKPLYRDVPQTARLALTRLDEPITRRRKRRKMPARVATERPREKPVVSKATVTRDRADTHPIREWKRPDGPRIADPNTM